MTSHLSQGCNIICDQPLVQTLDKDYKIFEIFCMYEVGYNNFQYFSDNEHPNLYTSNYHYTEESEPKNVLDFAYEAALEAGKFEAETLHDILTKLPTRKDLLWKVNATKTEKANNLKRIWNNILRFSKGFVNKIYNKLPRKMQYVIRTLKKLEIYLHNKLVCLEPMLKRRMGKMKFPSHGMGKYNGMPVKRDYGLKREIKDKIYDFKDDVWEFLASVDDSESEDDKEVEYLNDCFEDMPRQELFNYLKCRL